MLADKETFLAIYRNITVVAVIIKPNNIIYKYRLFVLNCYLLQLIWVICQGGHVTHEPTVSNATLCHTESVCSVPE